MSPLGICFAEQVFPKGPHDRTHRVPGVVILPVRLSAHHAGDLAGVDSHPEHAGQWLDACVGIACLAGLHPVWVVCEGPDPLCAPGIARRFVSRHTAGDVTLGRELANRERCAPAHSHLIASPRLGLRTVLPQHVSPPPFCDSL